MVCKKKCIIAFSHSNYLIKSAGVEKFIKEEQEVLQNNNIHLIQLFPIIELNKIILKIGLSLQYVGINIDQKFCAVVQTEKVFNYLVNLLNKGKMKPLGIQIHHLHGWNTKILAKIIKEFGLPVKFFIHDYDMVSPYIMNTDVDKKYRYNILLVSTPEYKKCKYYQKGLNYYNSVKTFLMSISNYIVNFYVPSKSTYDIWTSFFDEYKDITIIRSHLKYTLVDNYRKRHNYKGKLNLAYIGSTAIHKGFTSWKKLLKNLYKSKYKYYYFGKATLKDKNINSFLVDYQDKTLPSMTEQLNKNNIDVIFMWAECQETYCYTFYEAIAAGCFILTNDHSGNITNEVEKKGYGKVFKTIDECVNYLNSDRINKDLKEYVDNIKIPKNLKINNALEGLSFKENKKYSIEAKKKVHKNMIVTFLYKILRS